MSSHGLPRLDEPVRFPKWDTDPWHDFLVLTESAYAKNDAPVHPFERVIRLREVIAEEVPDSVTTFKLTTYLPEASARRYSPPMLALAGTWHVPPELVTTSGRRVVNPNNPDAHLYSDATAMCDCGYPVRRINDTTDCGKLPGREGHAESCHLGQRYDARSRLVYNRRLIFTQMAYLGCQTPALVRRLGFPESYTTNLRNTMHAMGITDYLERRTEGRRRMLRTLLVLARVHTPTEAARVYGFGRGATDMLAEETTANPRALYRARRRATSEHYEFPRGHVSKPTRDNRPDAGDVTPTATTARGVEVASDD